MLRLLPILTFMYSVLSIVPTELVSLHTAFVSAYSPSPILPTRATSIPGKRATFIANAPTLASSTSALFSTIDESSTVANGDSENVIPVIDDATNTTETSPSTLKQSLLQNVEQLQNLMEIDGDFSVDFGVKGGELNQTSRAPQKVDYYTISKRVGEVADKIQFICKSLSTLQSQNSSAIEPTKFLGDATNGDMAPLNGAWKLLFTTAADATFSKNSKRGAAKAQNIVNAAKGRITNVIDFAMNEDGTYPVLKQLNVVIRATADKVVSNRVNLEFKYAKAILTKFFGIPVPFGKTLPLYIPVPAAFITRIIVFVSRVVKFLKRGNSEVKVPPKAYFDILYLDQDLRIHKTGEDNLFVQAKDTWSEAQPFIN